MRMIYTFDYHYWHQPTLQHQQIEMAVVTFIAPWAVKYEVRLLAPKRDTRQKKRAGDFAVHSRIQEAQDLMEWIHENSAVEDLYHLRLFSKGQVANKDVAMFNHDDTASTWVLNVSLDQFNDLKEFLGSRDLPTDLFYSENNAIQQPYILFGRIPFGVKTYSPNEWRAFNEGDSK